MIKNRILLFAFFLSVLGLSAQTNRVITQESFSDTSLLRMHLDPSMDWLCSRSNVSGGEIPEAAFGFSPGTTYAPTEFTGTARVSSGYFSTGGYTNLNLSVKWSYTCNAQTSKIIGIAIRNGSQGIWQVLDSVKITSADGNLDYNKPNVLSAPLPSSYEGQDSVEYSMFFTNDYKGGVKYFFRFDDMTLSSTPLTSVSLTSGIPDYFDGQTAVVLDVKLHNLGTYLDSLSIGFKIDSSPVETYNSREKTGYDGIQDLPLVSNAWTQTPGAHSIKVWVNTLNGSLPAVRVDTIIIPFFIADTATSVPFKALIEEFTSSTCGNCAPLNLNLNPILQAVDDQICLIKYQVYFPGSGDPYYTPEVGQRMKYYDNLQTAPNVFGDGMLMPNPIAQLPLELQAAAKDKAYFTITLDTALISSDNMLTIGYAVHPLVSSNMTVQTAVVEALTYNNKRSNGETQFEHVMMKMFPDGNGNTVSFVAGQDQHFTYTYDMSKTHMERINDLKLAVFLQHEKAVYQSEIFDIPFDTITKEAKGTKLFIPYNIADQSVRPVFNIISSGKHFNSVELSYTLDGGNLSTQTFSNFGNLSYSQEKSLILDSIPVSEGTHSLVVWISKLDGVAYPVGFAQAITKQFKVSYNQSLASPLVEGFSSSDVPASAAFNEGVLYPIYKDQSSLINLAMYPTDSRMTTTGAAYKTALGVQNIPSSFVNGAAFKTNSTDLDQQKTELNALIAAAPKHSNFEITNPLFIYGENQVKSFKYDLTLMPSITGPFMVYYAVVETQTNNVVAANGEMTSYQTLTKLLKSGGDIVPFIAGKAYELKGYFNNSGMSYQDINNLRLIFFIKDSYTNASVLQSIQLPIQNCLANESANAKGGDQFRIYPNPAKDICHFTAAEKSSLQIFDGVGRLLETLIIPQGNCDLDLSRFKTGNYTMRLIGSQEVQVAKLLIVK